MDPHAAMADKCVLYAHMSYMWLPLFLGLVAGVCLLVATLRRTLTGGMAGSLAALAGVVVLGTVIAAAHPHGFGAQAAAAAKHGKAPDSGAATKDLQRAVEMLQQRVKELDAMAVLPWGFGKWLGRRGMKVRETIDMAVPGQLFLGDNSARLFGTPDPELFEAARAKGIAILPGTDPFPFPGQERRVGRMGFAVRSTAPLSEWSQLRAAIVAQQGLTPFGALEQPLPFIMNQVRMQVAKRTSRRRVLAY